MSPAKLSLNPEQLQAENRRLRAERSVVNSIQQGLAGGLAIDEIIDRAGQRIIEIFPGHAVALYTHDPESNQAHPRFVYEHGERRFPGPVAQGAIGKRMQAEKQPFMISTQAEFEAVGATTLEGTAESLSGIYCPLLIEDRVIGALNIESPDQENAFTEADLRLLSTIASSLSVALENARLFDELQRSHTEINEALAEQSAVGSILRAMAAMPSELEPVLQAVVEQAGQLCQADDVQVYQVDGDRLRQVAHAGPLPGLEQGETLPLVPELITGRAVLERRTIHTPDAEQISADEFPVSAELQRKLKHRSVIVTPLIREDSAIGAIVARRNQVRPFSDKQVKLLAVLADQAAIAIENVHLFHETKRLLGQAEQRAQELAIINNVQMAMAAKLDIQDIYDAVGNKLHEVFPNTQVVDILHYEPETQLLHPRFVIERGQRYQVDPWPARGFRKHVIETGEPLVINNDMATMAEKYDNNWVVLGEMAKSFVAVPMKLAQQVIGVITLQHLDRENAFSDSDVSLLQTLASSMSVALENARLFDETQRLLHESKERAAELAIINTIQRALADKKDVDRIYQAVGDELRGIFNSQVITIFTADLERRVWSGMYGWEKGEYLENMVVPFNSVYEHFAKQEDTIVMNGTFPEWSAQFDDYQVPQGELPQSIVLVPIPGTSNSMQKEFLSLQDIDGDRLFTDADVRLLETIASSVGVALENARLFDEIQRLLQESEERAAELAIINTVQLALAAELDIDSIYEAVGEQLRSIFDSQIVTIYSADLQKRKIAIRYGFEKGERLQSMSVPFNSMHEVTNKQLIEGEPLVFNGDFPEFAAQFDDYRVPQGELPQSVVVVPIPRAGRSNVFESISLQDVDGERYFSESDIRLLETLAGSMGVALENARLLDETQRLLQETEQRAAELATINTVGQALVAETELELLIDLIGEQVRQIFSADIVYVALLNEERDEITFPYSHGEEFVPIRLGEGLTSKIIETGQPLLINEEMDRRRAELGIEKVGKGASSYLGVPIQMGGTTFGVISAQSTGEEGRFDEHDLRLLNTVAVNVGTAIRNAQLFDEIKRQKQYYQAVIQNSPAAIVLLDMDANVTGWNPAAERLFGYSEPEALGRNVDELVAAHPDLRQEAIGYSRSVMREREISKLTKRTRKDGSFVEVDLAGVPVTVDGEYVGFIAIYHDVTELQQARLAAEQASQAKSTFLANMSHELRTPLNAIIGFSRIVRRKGEGSLPDKQLENLDKVLVSADHLLSLINTVLDIAKIEAGRLDVKPASFALPPLLEQVLATTQPLANEGVELSADVPTDLPHMYSDESKIRQILMNLLSNAAKFTHEGGITLTARQVKNHVHIGVSDTGIGIAPDALVNVFEEFQQADSSTTREYGGTGLGLAISRSLARLLGGDIEAESEPGSGSTFRLISPLHYAAAPGRVDGDVEQANQGTDPATPLLLAIDDDPNVHDLLRENLAEGGYQVLGATTAEQGLRLARELRPVAITLDIMMPQKDGWQVLSELKDDPLTRDIPVILLTIVDKPERGFRLGAADYLVKPIREEALLQTLDKLNLRPANDGPLRLLLVDDDIAVHELVGEQLEDAHISLGTATNGRQALDLIEQDRPDVILLDLMMPVMDGFELIRVLQQRALDIPIIVLTAKDLTTDELSRLKGSVERVMQKAGFGRSELFAELRHVVPGFPPDDPPQES